jgi:putative restriction endonuclease
LTANTAGTPVRELAALSRRPPSSILAKLSNLEGSRSNGGTWDRVAAEAWKPDAHLFESSYPIVILAGHRAGINARRLPAFLS